PVDVEVDVAQRGHGDVAHVIRAADAAQADDRLGARGGGGAVRGRREVRAHGRVKTGPPPLTVTPPPPKPRLLPLPLLPLVATRSDAVPVTTVSPSARPDLISAVVLVTSPTVTSFVVGVPSAPMTWTR